LGTEATSESTAWALHALAYAKHSHSALVTFDRALYDLAGKQGYSAVIPG
jgi:predicted nucleic acid-binding protein